MGTSYDVFTKAFLDKVTEYDFIRLEPHYRNRLIDGYRRRACAQFQRICQYDLLSGDDAVRELTETIAETDLDEIVDIVSEGMLVQWLKPYLYRADQLRNVLNTKDFSTYSPAELLLRLTDTYEMTRRNYTNMMREYSYNHGDLSDLSL